MNQYLLIGRTTGAIRKVLPLLLLVSFFASTIVSTFFVFAEGDYTITYNLDGGTNDSRNLDSYSDDDLPLYFYPPTKTNYQFVGWKQEGYRYSIPEDTQEDIELEADWVLCQGGYAEYVYNNKRFLLGKTLGVGNGYEQLFLIVYDSQGRLIESYTKMNTGNGTTLEDIVINIQNEYLISYSLHGNSLIGGSITSILDFWVDVYPSTYVYDGIYHSIDEPTTNRPGAEIFYSTDGVSYTTSKPSFVDAGVYEIYVKATLDGYDDAYNKTYLTITKRPITVAVDDASKHFGDSDPPFTGGIVSGSLVDPSDLVFIYYREGSNEDVGVYPGVLKAQVIETNDNYEITQQTGTFTIYKADKYSVIVNYSYAPTTGTGEYSVGTIVYIDAGTRTGYTFSGWTVDSGNVMLDSITSATTFFSMPAADVEVTANWTVISYTVTVNDSYAAVKGTGSYAEGVTVTINAGTRSGYTFNGWTVNSGGAALDNASQASTTFNMPGSNVTVTANWEPIEYTVTVNSSYAAVTGAGSYTIGDTVTINAGNRSGYTFNGWTINSGSITIGSSSSTSTSFTMPAENVTVTANWKQNINPPVTTYTVTYLPGTYGNFTAVTYSGLSLGSATPASPTPTGIAGYIFNGWSPAISSTVTGNATYTATWIQPVTYYSVTYAPGTYGTFAAVTTTGLVYGAATPAAPTVTGQTGYTFTGWNPSVSSTVTATVTYTAQWERPQEEEVFTVRFVDYDGRLLKTEQVARGKNASAPANPSREGYTFTGWDRDFSNVQSDITVRAQYEPVVVPAVTDSAPISETVVEVNISTPEAVLESIIEEGIPTFSIGNNTIPLYGGEFGEYVWALINLILAIIGILFTVITTVRVFVTKDQDNDDNQYFSDEDATKRRRLIFIVISIATGIFGILFFFFTEDTKTLMVLVDRYTIINALLFLLSLVGLIFAFKKKSSFEDSSI